MTIDFVSMLAKAQQATKAGSIERVLSLAGNMAGVIPGSTDKIDFDYALDKYSALLNNDPKMMKTADEVAKIREDRAHQEQAAQQAAIAEQLARGPRPWRRLTVEGQSPPANVGRRRCVTPANARDIRRYEKAAKLRETNRINFIVAAMSTPAGRVWFHDFLSACHIFADPFTGDALVEAYSKGERNVGLKVYNDIVSNCPNYFIEMMKEANIAEQVNDRLDSAGEPDESDADEPSVGE